MRFMMLMLPEARPTPAMTGFDQTLQQAGVLLAAGNCWMLQVRSREEALEWARRCPLPAGASIEIHPVPKAGDVAPPT